MFIQRLYGTDFREGKLVMSKEVTPDMLRVAIELAIDVTTANEIELKQYHAAFDAMAEKAEAYDASPKLDIKYYPKPWKFIEELNTTHSGTFAAVVDAKGCTICYLFWAAHPPEETDEATEETYAIGRAIAALGAEALKAVSDGK
jgi:hypothetical protein